MVTKRADDVEGFNKALDQFLTASPDARSVREVSQRLQLHLTKTQMYIPSYTRLVMDKNHGSPIIAVQTRTDVDNKKVFIYPSTNLYDKSVRRLHGADSMGSAFFAFGVPLRTLKLSFPNSRRIVFPLNTLEVPDLGVVYWISMDAIENEPRSIDPTAKSAAKLARTAQSAMKEADRQIAAASSDPANE